MSINDSYDENLEDLLDEDSDSFEDELIKNHKDDYDDLDDFSDIDLTEGSEDDEDDEENEETWESEDEN